MEDIFKSADIVVFWLGEEEEETGQLGITLCNF